MSRFPARIGASRELVRVLVIWALVSAVCTPLIVIFLGPRLPPGTMTEQAGGQSWDNTVMTGVIAPIVFLVLICFGYALYSFRHRGGAVLEDGPPLRGHTGTIVLWIIGTFAVVLFLAGWGTFELFPGERGAGGGQGPNPLAIATPHGAKHALPVQVIGQQWAWTFRFPTYGGVETTQLELPRGKLVEFHVTSLDVVHSFWAPKLGVKADAVPGNDNVAFVQATRTGPFEIRCAELCGIWHGHMYLAARVATPAAFVGWISGQQTRWSAATKGLPPYSRVYFPKPLRRAG